MQTVQITNDTNLTGVELNGPIEWTELTMGAGGTYAGHLLSEPVLTKHDLAANITYSYRFWSDGSVNYGRRFRVTVMYNETRNQVVTIAATDVFGSDNLTNMGYLLFDETNNRIAGISTTFTGSVGTEAYRVHFWVFSDGSDYTRPTEFAPADNIGVSPWTDVQPTAEVLNAGHAIGYTMVFGGYVATAPDPDIETPTEMELWLFQVNDQNIKLNKTLSTPYKLYGALRSESSIIDPVIMVEAPSLVEYNYAFIPQFRRYYYINNQTSIRTTLWRLDMHVDVLMSFVDSILNAQVIAVSATGPDTEMYMQGDQWATSTKFTTEIKQFPSGLPEDGEYILITSGGTNAN